MTETEKKEENQEVKETPQQNEQVGKPEDNKPQEEPPKKEEVKPAEVEVKNDNEKPKENKEEVKNGNEEQKDNKEEEAKNNSQEPKNVGGEEQAVHQPEVKEEEDKKSHKNLIEAEEAQKEIEENTMRKDGKEDNNGLNTNRKPSNRDRRNMSQTGIEDVQKEIQEMTKKIEHEKIDLRITTERLTQKEKTYNELQGKPVAKTNEEKEKDRREHKKAVKNHKLSDPIIRKKGKDKEFHDEQIKIQKENDKKRTDFEKLTCDINELVIENKGLKDQIIDLRKRKAEALKQRDAIMEENNKKQEELNEMYRDNKALKNQIKHKEYKDTIEEGNKKQKEFEERRDDLEGQYHKLIEEYIKRERETKKENARKRQMAFLGTGSKAQFKGSSDKDIEKQIKMLAAEEISDRTPILDICIDKWKEINKLKKTTIDRHAENCIEIEKAFEKITKFLDLDSFKELPAVFKKTEEQMANIGFYEEKLDLQIDELEQQKELITQQIDLLTKKRQKNTNNKEKFLEEKKKNVEVIENLIDDFEYDIEHKRALFKKMQPSTDDYLKKLNDSYLSDFVPNKTNTDSGIEYNEQTINKFISNVQDYYKLIQTWDQSVNSVKKSEDNKEIDRLREEMKQKLGGFEKNRLMNKKLYTTMKSELRNGIDFEEIIRNASKEINESILGPHTVANFNKSVKNDKNNNSSMNNQSQALTTDAANYQYANDSSQINQQQSSIIVPNNSVVNNTRANNSSALNENSKIAEAS